MLRELSIKNFAIIDDLSISFEEGLTVLTGETGAGKSIIINAVNLILGSRASPELIRTSEETAELEAMFEVPPESPAARAAQAQGFDLSEGLVVRRVIHKNGRHRIYINGRLSTVQMLSTINEHLASISGQHAHQSLLKPEHHLLVLDQFGGVSELRGKVSKVNILVKTFNNGGQTTPFSTFNSYRNSCLFLSYGLADAQVFRQTAIGAYSAFFVTHAVIYS